MMIMQNIGEKGMLGYNELLTEKCQYEKYQGVDNRNQKHYSDVEELNCFTSYEFSNERKINQQDLNITKRIFISKETEPNLKDRIDGLEIKDIKPVKRS